MIFFHTHAPGLQLVFPGLSCLLWYGYIGLYPCDAGSVRVGSPTWTIGMVLKLIENGELPFNDSKFIIYWIKNTDGFYRNFIPFLRLVFWSPGSRFRRSRY